MPEKDQPKTQPPRKPCNNRRISCEVTRPERAGRAPYNFVPLTTEPWNDVPKPPAHSRFHQGLHSGIIELELKAKTPFYIRGMWPLPEFLAAKEDKPVQKEPFQVHGQLRLPGSTLRGLLRTMVEIMSGAPIDYINDTQLFFRTVASVSKPDNMTSFEPHAGTYKKRIFGKEEPGPKDRIVVSAGYLYASLDEWYIQPATKDSAGRQFYRFRTDQVWARRPVRFDVHEDMARVHDQGKESGWLICSGPIFRKSKQWVVRGEDPDTRHRVLIPYGDKSQKNIAEKLAPDGDMPDDVKAYKDGGITGEIKKNGFEFTDHRTKGIPCFYVKWSDPQGREHISFGHTPYFRLPYVNRPPNAIPRENTRQGREEKWDMARAIFGWVSRSGEQVAFRGRVTVEDGVLVAAPAQPVAPKVRRTVLGQPKPTTYQHYLVQNSDRAAEIIHWDGTCKDITCMPIIRGHKLYWHRPGAEIREPEEGKGDTVATEFRPAAEGAVFLARVRYDNLQLEELGTLLATIKLPEGCAHHLGMAKPLGLGSFEISLRKLIPIDRPARYRVFLTESGSINSGFGEPSGLVAQALLEFAHWYSNKKLDFEQLWATPRFKELKALLTFSEQQKTESWRNMTRYLEFGRLKDGNYNEYLQVPDQPRPRLEKRRTLPPATQVARLDPKIPSDPRPQFQKRR